MSSLFIPPLDQWPMDLLYEFYERASIKEFCGGMSRHEAEAAALVEVWESRVDNR